MQQRKWRRKRKNQIPRRKRNLILLGQMTLGTTIHFIILIIIIHILLLLHFNLMALTDLAKLTLLITTQRLITPITITQTIHAISLTSDTLELLLQSPKTVRTISLTSNTLELFSVSLCYILHQSRSQLA